MRLYIAPRVGNTAGQMRGELTTEVLGDIYREMLKGAKPLRACPECGKPVYTHTADSEPIGPCMDCLGFFGESSTPKCRGCESQMVRGVALEPTVICSDDFGGDAGAPGSTCNPGPGKYVGCWKCPKCGHSFR